MASVYVVGRTVGDGSRRFDVKYRKGGRYTRVEHAGTFHKQGDANTRRDLVRSLLAAGQDPAVELRQREKPARIFSAVAAEWLASRRRVAHGTHDGYRHRMPRLYEAFEHEPLDAICFEDVIAWIATLERDYAPGTVHLFVRQLRMILDFAGGPNVARDRRVELPRNVQKEPDPPDAAVLVAALERLSKETLLPVVAMEQLGTRIGETLALRPSDVGDSQVRLRREITKGQRVGRALATKPWLVQALAERLPMQAKASTVQHALAQASGKSFHPHDLRHRRATLWYQQGIGPVELARRLGHARPSMSLDVYANVRPLSEVPAHVLASFLR